ncbi:MAG: glycosyltransferase [Thermomicrobiales bacterium]|nr:glycosyltransferase [Thermomicrobiales bacterium]
MAGTHVLLVTGEYPPTPGGVGDYTDNLRSALSQAGIGATAYAPASGGSPHVVEYGKWGWRAARRVGRVARHAGADVIHIQYQSGAFDMHPSTNMLPWMLRKSYPVITTFHDLRPPYLFPKASFIRRFTMLRMARTSSQVVVTNPFDAGTLTNAGIEVVEIPIGPNLPAPDTAATPDMNVVGFFGFPSRAKGIVELIEAIGLIDSRRRPNLLLIGDLGTPSPNNDLVALADIERLAGQNEVTINQTGYLSAQDASNALASVGAIALPFQRGASLRSGSLLAALQAGRPVIATAPPRAEALRDLGSLPQLLSIPRGDTGKLWDAIESALSSPFAAVPLPERFDWSVIASAHGDLYRSVIDQWERDRR